MQRHEYLRHMSTREEKLVIYLNETWANAHDSVEKMWVEDDRVVSCGTLGGLRKPSGKGSRLIILHAGEKEDGRMSP